MVINVRATRRGGSDKVWRGREEEDGAGGGTRIARSRCAALYTIGYEVAVTCSWPADDVTHSVTRAPIDYTEGIPHTSVGPFDRRSILGLRL